MIDVDHLLSVEAAENEVTFRVTREGHTTDFAVRKAELLLQHVQDGREGDSEVKLLLHQLLHLLG